MQYTSASRKGIRMQAAMKGFILEWIAMFGTSVAVRFKELAVAYWNAIRTAVVSQILASITETGHSSGCERWIDDPLPRTSDSAGTKE